MTFEPDLEQKTDLVGTCHPAAETTKKFYFQEAF